MAVFICSVYLELLRHGDANEIVCSPVQAEIKKKKRENFFHKLLYATENFLYVTYSKMLYVKYSKLLYVNLYRGNECPKHIIVLYTNPKGKHKNRFGILA